MHFGPTAAVVGPAHATVISYLLPSPCRRARGQSAAAPAAARHLPATGVVEGIRATALSPWTALSTPPSPSLAPFSSRFVRAPPSPWPVATAATELPAPPHRVQELRLDIAFLHANTRKPGSTITPYRVIFNLGTSPLRRVDPLRSAAPNLSPDPLVPSR